MESFLIQNLLTLTNVKESLKGFPQKVSPTSFHGTTIRTGITCKKIPLLKSIEFGMALK